LLTLARNARTTPDMIDRYYAAQLKGEDNVDMLQSRRKRKVRREDLDSTQEKGRTKRP
jgi:hypothetical protein